MKKFFTAVIMLCVIVSGCSNQNQTAAPNVGTANSGTAQSTANSATQQQSVQYPSAKRECEAILDALSAHDKEKLKSMFCADTVSGCDIDARLDEVLDYFEGKVTYVNEDDKKFFGEEDSWRDGKRVMWNIWPVLSGVKTDAGKMYTVSFTSCLINDSDPAAVGLISLRIYRGDDDYYFVGVENGADNKEESRIPYNVSGEPSHQVYSAHDTYYLIMDSFVRGEHKWLKSAFCVKTADAHDLDSELHKMRNFMAATPESYTIPEYAGTSGLPFEKGHIKNVCSRSDGCFGVAEGEYDIYFYSCTKADDPLEEGLQYIEIKNSEGEVCTVGKPYYR